jgi:glucokinase
MASNKLFLAGDIGGTKTNIGIFSLDRGKLRAETQNTFPNQAYAGLEPLLREFLKDHRAAIKGACFGVAGPVHGSRVKMPNLPWVIDAKKIAQLINLRSVTLLNDLEATAYGIFTLQARELFALNQGKRGSIGNKALIAAGTGLGQATLFAKGNIYHPSASEGGHGDFAPRNELEIDLLRYLIGRFGHVSYERVVSGPGIWNVYQFLREKGVEVEPAWLKEKLAVAVDPSIVVTEVALSGENRLCEKALNLVISTYGAEAGNLALRAKATGGLYIGGGIAPKILAKLKDGTFMRAFVDKGRYKDLVSAIPVRVILNEKTALQGAAFYATHRFNE